MSGTPPSAPGAARARTAPSRDALLAVHRFPGEFVIKAFGPGAPGFRADVAAAARAEVGEARVAVEVRSTPSGGRSCVTLTLQIETVEEVEAVYARLHALPELFLIL
jgi:putative lipoic acid-binding regulatory protein